MIVSVFDRVENILGKGEIACTSNFFFSQNVFKWPLSQTGQKVSLCGNGLKQLKGILESACRSMCWYFFWSVLVQDIGMFVQLTNAANVLILYRCTEVVQGFSLLDFRIFFYRLTLSVKLLAGF